MDLQGCRPRGGRSPSPSFSPPALTPDTVPLTVLGAIPEDRRGAPGPGPCAQEGPTLHSVLFCRSLGIPDFWMRGPRVFILYQALQTRQPVLPRRNGESSSPPPFFFIVVETADERETRRESEWPPPFLVALYPAQQPGPLAQKCPSRERVKLPLGSHPASPGTQSTSDKPGTPNLGGPGAGHLSSPKSRSQCDLGACEDTRAGAGCRAGSHASHHHLRFSHVGGEIRECGH